MLISIYLNFLYQIFEYEIIRIIIYLYGVIPQFPKPVKPVLQLPNLESHRFNLSQTKKRRSEEIYNHMGSISNDPGGLEEFLPCSRAHMIRRILLCGNLPKLDTFPLWRTSHHSPTTKPSKLQRFGSIPYLNIYLENV